MKDVLMCPYCDAPVGDKKDRREHYKTHKAVFKLNDRVKIMLLRPSLSDVSHVIGKMGRISAVPKNALDLYEVRMDDLNSRSLETVKYMFWPDELRLVKEETLNWSTPSPFINWADLQGSFQTASLRRAVEQLRAAEIMPVVDQYVGLTTAGTTLPIEPIPAPPVYDHPYDDVIRRHLDAQEARAASGLGYGLSGTLGALHGMRFINEVGGNDNEQP